MSFCIKIQLEKSSFNCLNIYRIAADSLQDLILTIAQILDLIFFNILLLLLFWKSCLTQLLEVFTWGVYALH